MGEVGRSLVGFRGQDSGEARAGAARQAVGWQVGRSRREARGWVPWERTQNKVGGSWRDSSRGEAFSHCS